MVSEPYSQMASSSISCAALETAVVYVLPVVSALCAIWFTLYLFGGSDRSDAAGFLFWYAGACDGFSNLDSDGSTSMGSGVSPRRLSLRGAECTCAFFCLVKSGFYTVPTWGFTWWDACWRSCALGVCLVSLSSWLLANDDANVYLWWFDSTSWASASAVGMSFGFAEKITSVRMRLSPEIITRSASSRNLSHKTFAANASYDIVALLVSKVSFLSTSS